MRPYSRRANTNPTDLPPPITNYPPPATHCRPPATDYPLPTTDHPLLTMDGIESRGTCFGLGDRRLSSVATVDLAVGEVRAEALSRDELAYGFKLLAITTFCMTLALSSFDSIQANFFRDSLGMDGKLNGYLIAIR